MLQPFHETVEDFARGRCVSRTAARQGQAIEVRPVWFELRQVALREVEVLRVERFQVAIQELAGHLLIERLLHIVVIGQHEGGRGGNLAVNRTGGYRVKDVGKQGRRSRQGQWVNSRRANNRFGEHSGKATYRLRINSRLRLVRRSIMII